VIRTGYAGYYAVESFGSRYEMMLVGEAAQRAFSATARLFTTLEV